MFRFSIRELMLVTFVVGLAVGWAIDHWRPNNAYRKMEIRYTAMEESLKLLGYEVRETSWGTAGVVRNKERPWIRNNEQTPGEPVVWSGMSP